uniref:Uncharacterized protein n=1 Tax=Triticum urartu TaxID=4572 RepID=A0A8R7QY86_TRIUA
MIKSSSWVHVWLDYEIMVMNTKLIGTLFYTTLPWNMISQKRGSQT